MNGLPRMAAAAAAATLVVIIGLALFNLSPNVGQRTQSPSPTAISTPAALPTPGPNLVTLAAGTYATGPDFPVRVSFTLTPGWHPDAVGAHHVAVGREDVNFAIMTVLNVYTNPYGDPNPLAAPPVGPSVDDLVTALTQLPMTESGTVSDVSIDGSQGKSFDLHVQFSGGNLYAQNLWKASLDYEGDGFSADGRQQLRVYVMDVQGQRIVFVTSYADLECNLVVGTIDDSWVCNRGPNADAYKAELQTIVDSIHILPAT